MKSIKELFYSFFDFLHKATGKSDQDLARIDLERKIGDISISDADIEVDVFKFCKKYDPEIKQDSTNKLISRLVKTRPELYNTLMCGK